MLRHDGDEPQGLHRLQRPLQRPAVRRGLQRQGRLPRVTRSIPKASVKVVFLRPKRKL